MSEEVLVMERILDSYIEDMEKLSVIIEDHVERLQKELVVSVKQKFSREMERFSERFRRFKRGEAIEGDLFVYDPPPSEMT